MGDLNEEDSFEVIQQNIKGEWYHVTPFVQ